MKVQITCLIFLLLISAAFAGDRINQNDIEKIFEARYQSFVNAEKAVKFQTQDKPVEKALNGMWSWQEGFEDEFPTAELDAFSGPEKKFQWGKVDTNAYKGKSAIYCAGAKRTNSFPYAEDFTFLWTKKNIEVPDDLAIKWAKLEFYLDLKLLPPKPKSFLPEGSFYLYIVAISSNRFYSNAYYFDENTDGYQLQSIDLEDFCDVSGLQHIYFDLAYYTKRRTIPAEYGAWIDDLKLRVHYWTPLKANFEAGSIAGKAPHEVTFFNDCEGAPNHFQYIWGDGEELEYSEPYNARTVKTHVYTEPGEYDVTIKCWNSALAEEITIPNQVYVDSVLDYCELTLVESGETYPGEDWTNAIDHDIYGSGCMAAGVRDDAWATFIMADSTEKPVSKIRLLNDVFSERTYRTNCAEDVLISLSRTGEFNGEESITEYTCSGRRGIWDEVDVTVDSEPVVAKFVKIEVLSSKGSGAPYREIVELQVLGTCPEADSEPANPGLNAAVSQPKNFSILSNYPNPFNPETTIRFQLEKTADISLAIYNIQGQLVKTLTSGEKAAGSHQVRWNGADQQGVAVAGGVYIYKLQINDETQSAQIVRKMLLIK